MLIEDLYKSVEKIEKNLEQNMTNKVNIEFLQKQVEKMSQDIEKLKDANREIVYKNGGTINNYGRNGNSTIDVR